MLKFIKHNMSTIEGIEVFPLFSFLVFFLFFVGLFVWVYKMKKSEVNELAALPFQDATDNMSTEKTNMP